MLKEEKAHFSKEEQKKREEKEAQLYTYKPKLIAKQRGRSRAAGASPLRYSEQQDEI